jgi:hypothetical protein
VGFNLQDYEPVEARLGRFWEQYPNGSVQTTLVSYSDIQFIVRATVFSDRSDLDNSLIATGFAEERVDSNPKRVNFASALENCETSAIGRALANANFQTKGQRPSREEMEKVNRRTAISQPATPLDNLRGLLSQWSNDGQVRQSIVRNLIDRDIDALTDLTAEEITSITKEVSLMLNSRVQLETKESN